MKSRTYKFWRVVQAPHILAPSPDLLKHYQADLARELAAFFAAALRSNEAPIIAMFKDADLGVVFGYGFTADFDPPPHLSGMRYLKLKHFPAGGRVVSELESKTTFRIAKRARPVVVGNIADLADEGSLSGLTKRPPAIDLEPSEEGIGHGKDSERDGIPFMDIDDHFPSRDVLRLPVVRPYLKEVGYAGRMASFDQSTSWPPGEGWILKLEKYDINGDAMTYATKAIQAYFSTYRGMVSGDQFELDLALFQSVIGLQEVFRASIKATRTAASSFLQDTDQHVFEIKALDCRPDFGLGDEADRLVSDVLSLVTSDEATALLMPPYSFLDAIPNVETFVPIPFVAPGGTASVSSAVTLGKDRRGTMVQVSIEDFRRHVFVSGGSGSGKSHITRKLLAELPKEIPFLIVDPAKDSHVYKEFALLSGASILTVAVLFGNPFIPAQKGTIFSHSARLAKALSLLSPVTVAGYEYWLGMIRASYHAAWVSSEPKSGQEKIAWQTVLHGHQSQDYGFLGSAEIISSQLEGWAWPSLQTIKEEGMAWLNSKFVQQGSSQALDTLDYFRRWWLLGQTTHPLAWQLLSGINAYYPLFNERFVLPLGGISDPQENAFIATLILMLLEEHRLSESHRLRASNAHGEIPLQHVTVIEEAHRLMPMYARGYGKDAVSSPEQEAAAHIGRMMAEFREHGEAFIIIEQSPSKLISDAIINSTTKIIKRTTFGDDVESLAKSCSLTEREAQYLPRLTQFEGIAILNHVPGPVYFLDQPH